MFSLIVLVCGYAMSEPVMTDCYAFHRAPEVIFKDEAICEMVGVNEVINFYGQKELGEIPPNLYIASVKCVSWGLSL